MKQFLSTVNNEYYGSSLLILSRYILRMIRLTNAILFWYVNYFTDATMLIGSIMECSTRISQQFFNFVMPGWCMTCICSCCNNDLTNCDIVWQIIVIKCSSILLIDIYNSFIHFVTSQYLFKPSDFMMRCNHNHSNTTTPPAKPSLNLVPLNGMFR